MANNEMWSCTDIKVTKLSYTWTINNFRLSCQLIEEFQSPTFSAEDNIDSLKWCLLFQIKREVLYLNLKLENFESKNKIKYKIYTLNGKSEKGSTIQREGLETFDKQAEICIGSKKLNEFLDGLSEDNLTTICEISVACGIVGNIVRYKEPECTLCEDFENLFVSEKFSDVTIAVAGREFRAHKAILAARSEVFAAMFEHEMEERQQNRVNITDFEPEVIDEMLRFIYMGKIKNPDKLTLDLLAAADKYAIGKLKVMCEKVIYAELSVETAAETLLLADLHSAQQLKAKTIDFINTHPIDVKKTKGWQNMLTTRLHVLLEAYKATASREFAPI